MPRTTFLIPEIILHDVVGTPRKSAGVLFVPALFEPIQAISPASAKNPLRDHEGAEQRLAAPLRQLAVAFPGNLDELYRPWIRGRINALFGLSVPTGIAFARDEILDVPFLAIDQHTEGFFTPVPLICVDGWTAGPALVFAGAVAEDATERRVASAFWELLLHEVAAVSPFAIDVDEVEFEEKYLCGFERGQFFVWTLSEESEADFEWAGSGNPMHRGLFSLPEERRPCPDCDGTGEESFLPAGATCELCCGRGYLR